MNTKKVGKKDGKLWKVDIRLIEDKFEVYEKDGSKSEFWSARIEMANSDGSIDAVIFQKEFSGILTGNLGKSYAYMQPVTEVMRPRFKISLFFGLTSIFLSYLVYSTWN